MTDPSRWRDGDAPETLRRLLAGAKKTRPMTAAERAALAGSVRAAAVHAAVPVSASVWVAGIGIAAILLGVGIGFAVRRPTHSANPQTASQPPAHSVPESPVGTTVSPLATSQERPVESPNPAVAPRARVAAHVPTPASPRVTHTPAAEAPMVPPSPAAETIVPSGTQPSGGAMEHGSIAVTSPTTGGGAPRAATVDLGAEGARIRNARALLAGHPDQALEAIDDYAAEFPSGQLRTEGELIAIRALINLSRAAQARTRASALIARHPNDVYGQQAQRLLESIESP